jgi:predicted DCC family thiol-disulfide oxidoreductase YuxK
MEASGAREPKNAALRQIAEADRLKELHAIDDSGRIFTGWAAIEEIAARTSGVRLMRPIFWILGFLGVGDLLYRAIAASPARRSCADGVCSIAADHREKVDRPR